MMTLLLLIIYISFISLGLPDSLLGSAWPVIQVEMGAPVSYAGMITMIISGGTIVSSFYSERMIRRFGTGLVTVISVCMTGVALLGFAVAPSILWMCVLAVPLGLGAGSVDAALNNFVALHYQAKHMNWLHCFWGVGATAGPAIMSFMLIQGQSWQKGYLAIGIIQVCLVFVLFLSLPLWKKFSTREGAEQASAVEPLKTSELLKIRGLKPALIGFFCYCAIEMTAGLWGSSYLVIHRGVSPEAAATWISVYYLGITLGRMAAGFVSLKLNNVTMVRTGIAGIAIGILLLLLPLGEMMYPIGFFMIGFGCAPIYPSMLHQTPQNFGSELSQSVMGLQMACAYIGSTLMPPLFGFIAQEVSITWFPFFLLAILVLMILMTEITNRAVARTPLQQKGKKDLWA